MNTFELFDDSNQFDFFEHILHRYSFGINSHSQKGTIKLLNKSYQSFLKELALTFEAIENFEIENFKSVSIPILLDYLQKTHTYYQSYYFSKIEQSIDTLKSVYHEAEDLLDLLTVFFNDYRIDISEHIAEEEEKLFPYITEMICIPSSHLKSKRKYSINSFLKHHNDDNENTLVQVINMIKQRYPDAGFSPLNILLRQIELFEKDLRIHHRIEEEILLPKALRLEALCFAK